MMECQKRAIKKYYQKRKDEGNPIKKTLKYIECPSCNKTYLNSNKSHHDKTKYHIEKLN